MSQKSPKDPFIRLQYIAFCRNYTTPADAGFADLVHFAKNYLCLAKKVLYYDTVWKHYSDEAILIEYYSVRMSEDSTFKEEIEAKIKGSGTEQEDDIDWMDRGIAEYNKNRDKMVAEKVKEAEINFKPEDIKDES